MYQQNWMLVFRLVIGTQSEIELNLIFFDNFRTFTTIFDKDYDLIENCLQCPRWNHSIFEFSNIFY